MIVVMVWLRCYGGIPPTCLSPLLCLWCQFVWSAFLGGSEECHPHGSAQWRRQRYNAELLGLVWAKAGELNDPTRLQYNKKRVLKMWKQRGANGILNKHNLCHVNWKHQKRLQELLEV